MMEYCENWGHKWWGVYGGLGHSNASCFHAWTFIAGFTAAGETASPPMERSQGHSQTRISIIFFIPQKKKRLKEREGEGGGERDGLERSSKREVVCMEV